MHSEDYLGFIANLVNCLKLGRNTSFDEAVEEQKESEDQNIGLVHGNIDVPYDQWYNAEAEQVSRGKDAMITRIDSYAEEGQRGIVLVMDNARIHHAKIVKQVLSNYNFLFLPSYSPMLNIIELWFS